MKKNAPAKVVRRRAAAPLSGIRTGVSAALWESLLASHDDLDEGLVICREGRPLYVSDGFCRLAGSAREALLAIPDIVGLFAGDELARSSIRETASGRVPGARFESRLEAGSGPGRFVEVSVRGVDGSGDALLVVRDITGRRNVEEQLRQSEERRRTLFENGSDAILLMRGSVFIDANETALALFGVPRGELLGKSACDFSPPRQPDGDASYEKWRLQLDAALGGERRLFEWKHLRPDGTPFDVEICLGKVEIAGELLTQAVVRDITDRKRAEDALRKYEFIANTTGSLMTLVDRDYRYVAANNAYCVAQGKERGELIGRTMSELWGEELFRSTLKPAVDECLQGRSVNYEASFRFPSDRIKIYDVTYSPYWQHEGGWYVTHVVVVSHDITERRLAEQTLSREEDRLKANLRLSQMLDATVNEMCGFALAEGTRLTGSSAGYFAAIGEDRRTASLLFLPPDDGSGSSLPEDRGQVRIPPFGIWADPLRRRSPSLADAPECGADAWPVALEHVARSLHIPVMEGGTVVALAGVANKETGYTESDIHQLTLFWNSVWQILQQKRGRDQLRSSLDEKEVLLKEIHHRVKNNLQVVSSLLNLQSGYVRDQSDVEMFRESQNRIRSMALIHEKLYQSGNVSLVDFPQYARSLATTLFRSYRSDESNVSLEVDFGDVSLGIDAAVPCGLIINELLSNALKHAFPAGRGGKVTLGLRAQGGMMRLTVKDDGIGFPRGLDLTRPESLGLQLVNTLVAQIGGVLEVDRSNGTEFRIAFAPTEERRHPA
jgi:PAS domain S-box-containing protein